jgi:hypothetical protein
MSLRSGLVLCAISLVSPSLTARAASGTAVPANFPIKAIRMEGGTPPGAALETFVADIRRHSILCDGKLTIGLKQMGGDFSLIQFAEPKAGVVEVEKIGSAEKLNGLEWKGYFVMKGEAIRGRRNGAWEPWAATPVGVPNAIAKINGIWETEFKENYSKPASCELESWR